jgi:SnoaL-like domain
MGVVIATSCARCGRAQDAGVGLCAACDERAPLRYYAEYGRRYAARDLDAFMDLFADGWTMVLHSAGAATETIEVATCRAWTASVYAVSPDARFTIDEVLACDERVLAMRASYHGHGPGGRGEFAYVAGFVAVVEDGHSVYTEQYEYDDDAAMLARYAELTRG